MFWDFQSMISMALENIWKMQKAVMDKHIKIKAT